MGVATATITSDGTEIIAAKTGKSIKILGFWFSIPVGNSFGGKVHGQNTIYCLTTTEAQNNAFHGGLWMGDKSVAVAPVGKAIDAYLVGSGPVEVTLFYVYM